MKIYELVKDTYSDYGVWIYGEGTLIYFKKKNNVKREIKKLNKINMKIKYSYDVIKTID